MMQKQKISSIHIHKSAVIALKCAASEELTLKLDVVVPVLHSH